jgi:hypothetical protein
VRSPGQHSNQSLRGPRFSSVPSTTVRVLEGNDWQTLKAQEAVHEKLVKASTHDDVFHFQ